STVTATTVGSAALPAWSRATTLIGWLPSAGTVAAAKSACHAPAASTAAATDWPPQLTSTAPFGSEVPETRTPAAFSGPLTTLSVATAFTTAGAGGTPSNASTNGSRATSPCEVSAVMPTVTASGRPPAGSAPLVGAAVARLICQRKSGPTVVA